MNAAMMMETCPDSETLAAFSDGALDEKMRFEVNQHVADCGQCLDNLVELDAAKQERVGLEPDNVTRGTFGRRWIAPLVAAAAVVVVLFGVPSIREQIIGGDPMRELVEAANQAPKRAIKARLSGDFAYRDHQAFRGNGNENLPADAKTAEWAIQLAAAEAADHAAKKPSPANLHADGVGKLLNKHPADALPVLQEAAKADPRSVAILTDLSAAYYALGDYKQALAIATKAWDIEHTQAAAWNRALALEMLAIDAPGRTPEAAVAWDKYLELDSSSEWAEEVRTKHLSGLRP